MKALTQAPGLANFFPMTISRQKQPFTLAYAIRSFIGHLEGTQKALHTVGSYRSDLLTFQAFLEKGLGRKTVKLEALRPRDLREYSEYLVKLGLKTNTRRRKLLTVRRFLRYLTKRNKLKQDPAEQLPAPYKVERVPETIDSVRLLSAIRSLPTETVLAKRNQVLLWTLVESGCLVSEASKLKYEQFGKVEGGIFLQIEGKARRKVPISEGLWMALQELQQLSAEASHAFLGFNKFGSLGSPITPRGIELLVKHVGPKLGFEILTPRTIRHSAVVRWNRDGLKIPEIQERLGLRTSYAFRAYRPLLTPDSATSKSKS